MTEPTPQRQLRLEIPVNLSAIYSNAAIISQTNSEIVFDFLQIMPNDPRARVQARIVLTPANAKSLLRALEQNIARYEERYGEIPMPPQPSSLADQLFGNIRPHGDDNPPEGR